MWRFSQNKNQTSCLEGSRVLRYPTTSSSAPINRSVRREPVKYRCFDVDWERAETPSQHCRDDWGQGHRAPSTQTWRSHLHQISLKETHKREILIKKTTNRLIHSSGKLRVNPAGWGCGQTTLKFLPEELSGEAPQRLHIGAGEPCRGQGHALFQH